MDVGSHEQGVTMSPVLVLERNPSRPPENSGWRLVEVTAREDAQCSQRAPWMTWRWVLLRATRSTLSLDTWMPASAASSAHSHRL